MTPIGRTLVPGRIAREETGVTTSNRIHFRRRHDPWWDLDGVGVRRRRRVKMAIDIGILAVALLTLVLVFGTQPVLGI